MPTEPPPRDTAPATPYEPPPHGFRTFVVVWLSQSVSVLGSNLTYFAITIWLAQALYPLPEQKPELAFALAAVSLAWMLPMLLLMPLAGAWADRRDRKRTMVATDLLNGGVALALAALLGAGRLGLWPLVGMVAVASTIGVFHQSAFDTSYAMLVPRRLLPRANGMMQTMWSLSGIIAPALAAAIIALPALARQGTVRGAAGAALGRLDNGAALAILADGATFLAAAVVLALLPIPSPTRTDLGPGRPAKSIWTDVREGALYIWRRRPLLWLLGTFAAANLLGSPARMMMPLVLRFDLAADTAARGLSYEAGLALLNSAASLGGVAGGVLVSAWGGLQGRRVYGVLVPMIIAGISQVALGLSPLVYLSTAMAAAASSMLPIMNAHSQSIWQAQTPHELQGRVFAVRRVIAQCTLPLATALGGWAGAAYDPGAVVAALGAVLAAFCAAMLLNRPLLRVDDKAWLDRLAAGTAEQGSGS